MGTDLCKWARRWGALQGCSSLRLRSDLSKSPLWITSTTLLDWVRSVGKYQKCKCRYKYSLLSVGSTTPTLNWAKSIYQYAGLKLSHLFWLCYILCDYWLKLFRWFSTVKDLTRSWLAIFDFFVYGKPIRFCMFLINGQIRCFLSFQWNNYIDLILKHSTVFPWLFSGN